MIRDIEDMCPYWEICATTQFHFAVKQMFIRSTCLTVNHKLCTHHAGVAVLSREEVNRIKADFRDKYGESKTIWGTYR